MADLGYNHLRRSFTLSLSEELATYLEDHPMERVELQRRIQNEVGRGRVMLEGFAAVDIYGRNTQEGQKRAQRTAKTITPIIQEFVGEHGLN